MNQNQITVGLDIGTSKICAIVAAPDENTGAIKILGMGITESEGLNRGVVVHIDKTVNTIKKVIAQAEQQSGIKIDEVVVGIAGDHIESIQTRGIIGIPNSNHEITKNDVDRLLEEASRISLPADRKIIHVLPQDFNIDGQDGISDPIGMSGVRLEANVHIVTGMNTAVQNIYRCVDRVGLKVKDLVLEPIASSYSVLTPEEKEVGVALIDIGGGTTDIAIFEEGIIRFTSVFGIAGRHVTDDIRKVLGIISNQAEKIKREYGHCHQSSIMRDEVFMIPGIGGRKPMEARKSYLCDIIQSRMEELFEFAFAEIKRSGYLNRLGAGIVLTGGTTLLRGSEELAREVFGLPVKIGIPSGMTYTGLAPEVESPIYATSVGLVLFNMSKNRLLDFENRGDEPILIKENETTFINREIHSFSPNTNGALEAESRYAVENGSMLIEEDSDIMVEEEEMDFELDEQYEEELEMEKEDELKSSMEEVKPKKAPKVKSDKPGVFSKMKKFLEEL